MAVKLEKRSETNFKKYVGYFEGGVVAINPDASALAGLGINLESDPEYLKDVDIDIKDDEGEVTGTKTVKQLSLVFFIKDKNSDLITSARIFLKDMERFSKKTNKWQWVNSQGKTAWATVEGDLDEKMTKYGQSVVKAHEGEADLYEFLLKWLGINYTPDFEFYFDWKTLMKGNVKEIQDLMNTDLTETLLCPAIVRTTDEGKEYQQIFVKGIQKGFNYTQMLIKKVLDQKFIDQAMKDKAGKKKMTGLQRSVVEFQGEWGCKDAYYLGIMKEYNPEDDFIKNSAVVSGEKDVDSDGPSY